MNRFFFFSLLIYMQAVAFAQEYYPIGTMWEETMCAGGFDNPKTDEEIYAKMRSIVTGDSVLNGRTYKVVRMSFVEGGAVQDGSEDTGLSDKRTKRQCVQM